MAYNRGASAGFNPKTSLQREFLSALNLPLEIFEKKVSIEKSKVKMKSGLWRHPSGSELDLIIQDNGTLTGRYRTAGGRPGLVKWFPLTGFRNGDLLGFVVSWEEYHSLTSWCGRYVVEKDGREAIRTTWLLGRMFADKALSEPTAPWETFHINTDTYYFVEPAKSDI